MREGKENNGMNQVFISSLSLDNLFSSNDLSTATGYRYLRIIDDILKPFNCDFWLYEKGMGSLNESELKVFHIFLEIVRNHNVKFAKKQLIQELNKHGYNIQQNHQNNRTKTNRNRTHEYTATNKSSDFYNSLF